MDREKFKREFITELAFFSDIARRDIKKQFTMNQVEKGIVVTAQSFYGSRLDFDVFAPKKARFIAEHVYQIINNELDLSLLLEKLCNEIEEEIEHMTK